MMKRLKLMDLVTLAMFLGPLLLMISASAPCGCGMQSEKFSRLDGDFISISAAIKMYRINGGEYPSTDQGLAALVEMPETPPVPEKWTQLAGAIPKDPWGREYLYLCHSFGDGMDAFELRSAGRDGAHGTEDDISSWR